MIPKIIRALLTQPGIDTPSRMAAVSVIGFFFELLKSTPILPPFSIFASDYIRALTGIKLESILGDIHGAGSYTVSIAPLFSFLEFATEDPYTELQLPAELSPDGLLDYIIFDSITQKAHENSLVVLEEPEIHKTR